MLVCYIDESGDETPLRTRSDPPVLVLAGLIVESSEVKSMIMDYVQIKKEFNSSLARPEVWLSEVLKAEVKGSDLRKDIRAGSRRQVRRAFGYLDRVLDLLEERKVKIVAEVFVKGEQPLKSWVYSDAIAKLAVQFEEKLKQKEALGIMVLDARDKYKNVPGVHRITTERFKRGGDKLSHLAESPVFGHSDSHVMLQLSDIVASAFLFPMACAGYCGSLLDNLHIAEKYDAVRDRYGQRLQGLEHRYRGEDGKFIGGIRVWDDMNRQPSIAMFQQIDFVYRPPRKSTAKQID